MSKEINWNKNPQRKSDPYYSKFSMGNPFGSYETIKGNSGEWKRGRFITWHHTVIVYAQHDHIALSIYINGIGHYKSINVKSLPSDLSLSRQASKFSKEVKSWNNS